MTAATIRDTIWRAVEAHGGEDDDLINSIQETLVRDDLLDHIVAALIQELAS